MKLITTAQWGANDSKNATPGAYPIASNPGITGHWTGNGYGWPWAHSRCYDLVRGIERSHEYGNGWGDIAYNFLACPHGYVFEGRGLRVRSSANGNAARNWARYAVCYLGGVGDDFTGDGKQAFTDAVLLLHNKGGARLDVNGHRDGWSTQCPGDVIYHWLNATNWTQSAPAPTEEPDMTTAKKVWKREIPRTNKPAQEILRKVFRHGKSTRKMTKETLELTREIHAAVVESPDPS